MAGPDARCVPSLTASLDMRRLHATDARSLAGFLGQQAADYMRYFTPFAFDEESMRRQLQGAQADIFAGVYVARTGLVALWMLRGWDAGHAVPTFGLAVDGAWSNLGIGLWCLYAGITHARLRGATRLMSKVHADNPAPYRLNEKAGFTVTGQEGKIITMHKELCS